MKEVGYGYMEQLILQPVLLRYKVSFSSHKDEVFQAVNKHVQI